MKRLRYENLKTGWSATAQAGYVDWFELGGKFNDPVSQMQLFGSRWLDRGLGRFVTSGGGTTGLNPYPFANNSKPNAELRNDLEVKSDFSERFLLAVASGETGAAGMLFGARQLLDEGRRGLKDLRDSRYKTSFWGRALMAGGPVAAFAQDLVWDIGFDLAIGAVASTANSAEAWGKRFQGDFAGAARTELAGSAGILRESFLVQWAARAAFPQLWANGTISAANHGLERFGQRADAAAYERGADSALLFDTVALLPLDLIGVGAVATAGMSAARAGAQAVTRKVATSFAKRGFEATAHRVTQVGRFATETAPRAVGRAANAVGHAMHQAAEPFVSFGVHKVVGNVFGKKTYQRAISWAERNGWKACFEGWVPIEAQWGAKAIEDFKDYETFGDACDRVISRDENSPDGPLTLRRVLRKFERIGAVLTIRVSDRDIGITHEHPVFVRDKGWIPAFEIRVGDEVRLMEPGWRTVEAMIDTGRVVKVYNLEIEGDHTYFVGCAEWGFSIWAHNTYSRPEMQAEVAAMLQKLGYDPKAAAKIAKQYAKEGRFGDGIHANLKAYIDAGGEGFTAAGKWTRPANNRLPKGGVWTGQKGHSNFIPDNPAQLGLKPGEVIPFVEGVPNFSKWTHNLKGELVPNTTFVSRELLTGAKDDLSKMHRTIAAELGKFFKGNGKPIAAQGEAFLQRHSLTPHHSGGQTFQLLKWDLHGNPSAIPPINGVRHGDPGFGAASLRSGGG